MVRHHQIKAQLGGQLRLGPGRNAVVHRDDEPVALIGQAADHLFGKPVALPFPAGQHTAHIRTHIAQMGVEQRRGGHAVHIVIAEHHHLLFIVNGAQNALHGFVHVLHEHGVGEGRILPQQPHGLFRRVQTTGGQHPRQQFWRTDLSRQLRGSLLIGAVHLPGTVCHRICSSC